jgi:hypothetical protein
MDGSTSSTRPGRSLWAVQLGWGAGGGSWHRRGAQWQTEQTAGSSWACRRSCLASRMGHWLDDEEKAHGRGSGVRRGGRCQHITRRSRGGVWVRSRDSAARKKEKGRKPSTTSARPDKDRLGMGSSDDRDGGGSTRWKPAWATDWWARPGYNYPFKFPIQLKIAIQNGSLPLLQKYLKKSWSYISICWTTLSIGWTSNSQ